MVWRWIKHNLWLRGGLILHACKICIDLMIWISLLQCAELDKGWLVSKLEKKISPGIASLFVISGKTCTFSAKISIVNIVKNQFWKTLWDQLHSQEFAFISVDVIEVPSCGIFYSPVDSHTLHDEHVHGTYASLTGQRTLRLCTRRARADSTVCGGSGQSMSAVQCWGFLSVCGSQYYLLCCRVLGQQGEGHQQNQ